MWKDKDNRLIITTFAIALFNIIMNKFICPLPTWLFVILFLIAAVCLIQYWMHILKPPKKRRRPVAPKHSASRSPSNLPNPSPSKAKNSDRKPVRSNTKPHKS